MKTEKLNLVEILRGYEGIKLYSPIAGTVKLVAIVKEAEYPILTIIEDFINLAFTADGRYLNAPNGDCVLFPSKENRDWSTFKKPLKIEVGKTYLTRDERIVKVVFFDNKSKSPYKFKGFVEYEDCWKNIAWTINGEYIDKTLKNNLDLIKEVEL